MEMESLVKQAKAGDKSAFALLYEQIYKEMYKFAYCMLSNGFDAEDAVSETVIDAYKGIKTLKDDKLFKNWIFKILSIKCRRKMAEFYDKKVSLEEAGELKAESRENAEWFDLKTAFEELNYEERCIVTYNIVGGYSSREIGKFLNLNSNTVRSKLNRAVKKMKLKMEV